MKSSKEKYYRGLFLIAAIYDFILGIVFTFFPELPFNLLKIPEKLPHFVGYIRLIGAFLFVIGVAYYLIYKGDFQKNRDLIVIGALYKFAYFSITFFYFVAGSIPHFLFFAVFGIVDLIMLGLMAECLLFLKKSNKN